MSQLYVIENADGTFNFLKVGSNLFNALEQEDMTQDFIDAFIDSEEGMVLFLQNLGLSPNSIHDNIEMIFQIPTEVKDELLEYCADSDKEVQKLYKEKEPLLN